MTDAFQISLTYRGPLGHRGVSIARDTYGKTWTLRLADGVWTLIDHKGDPVHSFTQKGLHGIVALPGAMHGYPDLYFFGLGPPVHCFAPERDVVDALRPYVEQSRRADAPHLANWHRAVGVRFLGLGALGLAVCAAALSWAVWSAHASGYTRFNVGLLLLVPVALLGGSFIVGGVRELLKAKHFAGIAAARERPDS